jgi:RimJ/RimL family protein N-acetyltransferase
MGVGGRRGARPGAPWPGRRDRQLVDLLLDTTPVHLLCAYTEVDNAVEQRVLEKCGFRREGVLRQAGFRGGQWRDVAVYALLRI